MNVEWFGKNESFIWLVLVCLCCHHYGAAYASPKEGVGMGWSMGRPAFTKDAKNEMTQSEEADLRKIKDEFHKKRKGLSINNFMSEMGVQMPQEIAQSVDFPESSSEESGSESGSYEYSSEEEDSKEISKKTASNTTEFLQIDNSTVNGNLTGFQTFDNQTLPGDNSTAANNQTIQGPEDNLQAGENGTVNNATDNLDQTPASEQTLQNETIIPESPIEETPQYEEPEEREEEYPDQQVKEDEDPENQSPSDAQPEKKENEEKRKSSKTRKPKFKKPGRRLKKKGRRRKKKPGSGTKTKRYRTRKILQFHATTLGTSITDSEPNNRNSSRNQNNVSNGPTFNGRDVNSGKNGPGSFSKQSLGKSTLSFHKSKRFRTSALKGKPFGSTRSSHVHSLNHKPKGPGYQNIEKSETSKFRKSETVNEVNSENSKPEKPKKPEAPTQTSTSLFSRSINTDRSQKKVETSQTSSKKIVNDKPPEEKKKATKYEKQSFKMEGIEINYTRKQGSMPSSVGPLPMLYEQR